MPFVQWFIVQQDSCLPSVPFMRWFIRQQKDSYLPSVPFMQWFIVQQKDSYFHLLFTIGLWSNRLVSHTPALFTNSKTNTARHKMAALAAMFLQILDKFVISPQINWNPATKSFYIFFFYSIPISRARDASLHGVPFVWNQSLTPVESPSMHVCWNWTDLHKGIGQTAASMISSVW